MHQPSDCLSHPPPIPACGRQSTLGLPLQQQHTAEPTRHRVVEAQLVVITAGIRRLNECKHRLHCRCGVGRKALTPAARAQQ